MKKVRFLTNKERKALKAYQDRLTNEFLDHNPGVYIKEPERRRKQERRTE
jgi:hypothetical protein